MPANAKDYQMTKGFQHVDQDTAAARRGILPPGIKIDGYDSAAAPVKPPAAAIFDRGTSTREGAFEAQQRRRDHSRALGEARSRP